jgi:rRNA-processing protein FCF1
MDKTKNVILDTNFLMIPYAEKIDIFQEIDRLVREGYMLFTFSGVIGELEGINEGKDSKGRDKVAARIALQMIEKRGIRTIESHGKVDDALMEFARMNKEDTIVCTNDKELRRKLRMSGIPVIFMRGENRLEFSEH